MVTQTNGCAAVGLQLVIPRTQTHYLSMFSFVVSVLGATRESYFQARRTRSAMATASHISLTSFSFQHPHYPQVVPGVYKATSGASSCAQPLTMNSVSAAGCRWIATDGGAWFLRNTTYGEPNGDYNGASS